MGYFVTRHKHHHLPLDPASVEDRFGSLEGFGIEGPEHPRMILRSAQSHDTRAARQLAEELPDDLKGLAGVAVLVEGVAGDFSLYSGSWDGEGWDWPKLESVADARRRCESLMRLDDVDLIEVAEVASGLAMLKPGEEGNSERASNSSTKEEESTSPPLD